MNLIRTFLKIEDTDNRLNILIRILAGGVFLWEGIIKFLFVNQGAGRFAKLGFANSELVAGGIGAIEIVGGISLILGLATKQWSIVFIVEMIVAMILTKIPLYLGTSPLAPPPSPPVIGIWAVLHEIRSEFSQLLSCIFLFLAGPGKFSVDGFRKAREKNV
ncbi:DoxX family protein [Leptospira adleri]|uniref:DoxX family protein n=1 Tax=Leptospira adleri TaxID=2023186 RepID=A0A2M9YPH4_9LEPT|nr:DoxX family protein [Leptospira adleri]PJZ53436.1 DoxX family protein [Leptospira adleri]PJZ63021.1 DoxX family protein [Leptospira adleri]